jgi:hypothetical protein
VNGTNPSTFDGKRACAKADGALPGDRVDADEAREYRLVEDRPHLGWGLGLKLTFSSLLQSSIELSYVKVYELQYELSSKPL